MKSPIHGAAQRGVGSHSIRSCNPWECSYFLDKLFEVSQRGNRQQRLVQLKAALKAQGKEVRP